MKNLKILIPTDFSVQAEFAYNFSAKLSICRGLFNVPEVSFMN
jgi:hypothetical protein